MCKIEKILDWIGPRCLPIIFGMQTIVYIYFAKGTITNDVLFFALFFCTSIVAFKLDQLKETISAKS